MTNNQKISGLPSVILKQKEAYRYWSNVHRNFPKIERLGIGNKIENNFLSLLEITFASVYLTMDQKEMVLGKAISKLDFIKFFVQIAWENKLIPIGQYINLVGQLEEIGRQLGGWKKGLKNKTPTKI